MRKIVYAVKWGYYTALATAEWGSIWESKADAEARLMEEVKSRNLTANKHGTYTDGDYYSYITAIALNAYDMYNVDEAEEG